MAKNALVAQGPRTFASDRRDVAREMSGDSSKIAWLCRAEMDKELERKVESRTKTVCMIVRCKAPIVLGLRSPLRAESPDFG